MNEIELNLDDVRRTAPRHYWARAENARFAAWTLWNAISRSPDKATMLSIEYHGTAAIALYEAFRRESAISLELIIKAAIAWQIEDGSAASHLVSMPMSHDLPRLWRDARLPPLSRNDARWLLDMKWALLWSSRYPAPKDGAARQRQQVDLLTFERSAQKPKPLIGKMESFGWNDLNRIYSFVEEHRVEGRRD